MAPPLSSARASVGSTFLWTHVRDRWAQVHVRSAACRSRLWTPNGEQGHHRGTTLMTGTSLLRRGLPGALTALLLAVVPASASADGLSVALNGCPAQTIEHPFARWLDNANYVLAPGGTFEGSLAGWKLTGGAKVVAGSEPFAAHGPGEKLALS